MGFLSEAIKEKNINEPHEVFNYVRKRLIDSIGNDGPSPPHLALRQRRPARLVGGAAPLVGGAARLPGRRVPQQGCAALEGGGGRLALDAGRLRPGGAVQTEGCAAGAGEQVEGTYDGAPTA